MFKRLFEINDWKIIENIIHKEDMRLSESIMSIGNGYMGMRGNFEEKYSGDTHQGTYIGGVWFPDKTRVGWWKIGYPEYFGKVINSANFIGIGVQVNGHEIDLAADEILEFHRELDMKNAVLYRRFIVNTPFGRIKVNTERFLSINQLEICAIRYMVCALDNDVSLRITPYINGDVCNEDSNYKEKFWEEVSRQAVPLEASLTMRTKENPFDAPRFNSCTAMKINVYGQIESCRAEEKESFVSSVIGISAKKQEWVGIDKFIALTTTRKLKLEEVEGEAKALVSAAALQGYEAIKKMNSLAWSERWNKADVEINGDIEAQQGIRFNIFQLFSTYYGDDCTLNFGPKGFTGEKYGGATYWDTEAYVFPMYLSIAGEDVARNLLIYRYNQLEGAYENARKIGMEGALYPMVTFTGVECHNEWEITFEEIHRNCAIAFAIFQYVSYTGDKSYINEYGIDVLIGVSRFWASRVHYSQRNKKYMIHGVTGPNEYENNVNNNWYTNRMASWCLEYTLECIAYLRESCQTKKIETYSFSKAEEAKWRDIIENMYLPYNEELGIYIQNDTYLDKELKSVDEIPLSERPINQNWSWDKILRSCFIKQADVLQGLYFLGHLYDSGVKRKNFLFYEPMTVHESSLSPCIHAILAAELGIEDKAVEMYKRTARLDLDNYNNDTEDGLHITSMSGSWLAIVQGFAGMRTAQGKLEFKPFLPEGWKSYSFKVNYRRRRLKIEVDGSETNITLEIGEPLNILLFGKEQLLEDAVQDSIENVAERGVPYV
jgi:maltose phosphorylase